MRREDELVIRINSEGKIFVEDIEDGVKKFKTVEPDVFLKCVKDSIKTGLVTSGIMPEGSFFYGAGDGGTQKICIEFPKRRCDIVYEKTEYHDFPLPRLVFGFLISKGKITNVNLGVVDEGLLTPKSKMYIYPFSNVSGFRLCCGGNKLPEIKSLHQLTGVMHFIMSMPNNNDHYRNERTKFEVELRQLFEMLKDKEPKDYYSDVLIASGKTLQDFVNS